MSKKYSLEEQKGYQLDKIKYHLERIESIEKQQQDDDERPCESEPLDKLKNAFARYCVEVKQEI